jgi:predicted RNase H-like HicB family nuclease
MSICADIEQEKDGRWVAKLPGIPEVSGYGLTRHEAAVGLTVRALRILADRVESGQLEVEDEPTGIRLTGEGESLGILAALLDTSAQIAAISEVSLPESFLAGWADYQAGRVVDMDRALEDEP